MPRCGDWENSIACKTVEEEASMPLTRTPTRMTRPVIPTRNLHRRWTPWRRNTLRSRPPWQMSQASTRQEMSYTQRPWKWLKLERTQQDQVRPQGDLDCSCDGLAAATKEFSDCLAAHGATGVKLCNAHREVCKLRAVHEEVTCV